MIKKIVFAHQLRGLAALSVVFSHLAGNFFLKTSMVIPLIGAFYIPPSAPVLRSIHAFFPPYFFGQIGVAVFF